MISPFSYANAGCLISSMAVSGDHQNGWKRFASAPSHTKLYIVSQVSRYFIASLVAQQISPGAEPVPTIASLPISLNLGLYTSS